MIRKSTSSLLDQTVDLLVQHFGVQRVRTALDKVSNGVGESSQGQAHRPIRRPGHLVHPSVTATLEDLRQRDQEKHGLLADFYTRLKDKQVLPESQDIRHFAQLIGLKEISGKSRKDLVPRLMRFLFEQPTERLQADIRRAESVSEQQRQEGFSVLTDKLLADK